MKLGLVSFCNDGYPREVLRSWLDACKALLHEEHVVDAGLVYNMQTAKEKAALVQDCDAMVVVCLSACGSMYATEFLRPHFHKPILLWMAGGEEEASSRLVTGAAGAGFASLRMPLTRLGAEHLLTLVGTPRQATTCQSLQRILRVLHGWKRLRDAVILMIGFSDLGFYTGTFDAQHLKRQFGTEIVHIPSLLLPGLMESVEKERLDAFEVQYAQWKDGARANSGEIRQIGRLYEVLRSLVGQYHADGLTLKCFEGFTQCMGFTPCIPLSLLGAEVCTGCKCDIHAMVSQLVLQFLTGAPAAFMEIYDIHHGKLLLANCGLTPTHQIQGQRKTGRFTWGDVDGIIDASQRRSGTVTLLRVDTAVDGHYVMHGITAQAAASTAWKELGWDDPAPEFPSLEISIDYQQFMDNTLGQHYAVCYADVCEELRLLAKLLGIEYR